MMNEILRYSFDKKPVRIVEQDGVLWFCLADLGNVLEIKDHKNFLRSKACDKEGVCQIPTPTSSGDQEMTFISEPNMYAMTLRSDKEASAPFRRWVTHDVLPRIRKTGRYEIPGSAPIVPDVELANVNDPIIQMMTAMISQRQAQLETERRVAKVENRIDQLEQARIEAAESVKALPGTEARELTPREACREGVRRLRELTSMGFQDIWREAYSKYNILKATNVTVHAEKKGLEKLDYIEKYGDINTFLGVIKKMISKAAETAAA